MLINVKFYGYKWLIFDGMFVLYVSDVVFDIDMVFFWVDGSDFEFWVCCMV